MKKANLFMAITLLATTILSNSVSARIWRVNNLSNYSSIPPIKYGDNFGGIQNNPVFKTIDDAQNAIFVLAHDTLYLEGTPSGNLNVYPHVTLLKPLVIIGTGYFLQDNTNVSSDFFESRIDWIAIAPSASGTQLVGISFTGYGVYLKGLINNITIKRCYFSENSSIQFNSYQSSDIYILQNFFDNTNSSGTSMTFLATGGVGGTFEINFNIFKKSLFVGYGTTNYSVTECKNNVFDYTSPVGIPIIKMDCPSFKNNIVKTSNYNVAIVGNVHHNTGVNNIQFANGINSNHIISTANMANLFNSNSTIDGNYQLINGFAYNYLGDDGEDRGVYGGITPELRYTLSGLAPIPVIYDLYTSGVATPQNGLPVTIKARTIK